MRRFLVHTDAAEAFVAHRGLAWPRLALFALLLSCAIDRAQGATTATAGTALKPPRVFGYIQVFYRYAIDTGSDSLVDNDNFRVQRVRIGIEGDVKPWLSYDVEIDPRAPEITSVLRDAFLRLKVIPRHEIRIGQQKTAFGYENGESSTNLYAVNRTDVSDNLSRGITLRDIGIGLTGSLKLGKGLRLEDAITVVNGAGMNVQEDNTRRKNVWGRLGLRYRDDRADFLARLGVSGGSGDKFDIGEPLDPSDDLLLVFERYGVDLELDHPRAFLSAECVSGHQEDRATGEKDEPLGWYVNLAGKTKWRIGPIVRYEDLDDEFKRYTLGAYYGLPAETWRLMANYEYRKVKDGVRGDDKLYLWTQVRF